MKVGRSLRLSMRRTNKNTARRRGRNSGHRESRCDAVNRPAAMVNAAGRVVEHSVFVKDLVDRRTPTLRIDVTEHVSGKGLAHGAGRTGLCDRAPRFPFTTQAVADAASAPLIGAITDILLPPVDTISRQSIPRGGHPSAPSPIPEPSRLARFGFGLLGLVGMRVLGQSGCIA